MFQMITLGIGFSCIMYAFWLERDFQFTVRGFKLICIKLRLLVSSLAIQWFYKITLFDACAYLKNHLIRSSCWCLPFAVLPLLISVTAAYFVHFDKSVFLDNYSDS